MILRWIIEVKATEHDPWRFTGIESVNARHAWMYWDRQRRLGHIDYYAVQARRVNVDVSEVASARVVKT